MAQEIADSKLLDTWSSSGTKIEPDISKIIEGWQLGEQPPHEYMNWLQNTFGSKLNHILKNGIAEWNNETEYLAGASVQHSGNVWICETTNINSEPTDLNANWERVAINKDLTVPVDTLADLRSISYPAYTVWASGYHTKNDGAFGSHIFRLKGVKTTETDNSGTVIIATIEGVDYVYELQHDGAVNVKWFGAVGDGDTTKTDNQAALTLASTFVALSGGEILIEASGNSSYYVASPWNIEGSNITLTIKNGAELWGDQNSSDGHTVAFIHRTVGQRYSNCHIRGGGTVRNTATGTNENGIGFSRIENFSCIGMNIPTANRKAITAQVDCHNGLIDNNTIGITGDNAIAMEGGGATVSSNITVTNNIIAEAGGIGVYANVDTVHISNNIVKKSKGSGFYFANSTNITGSSNESHDATNGEGVFFSICTNIKFGIYSLSSAYRGVRFNQCGGKVEVEANIVNSSMIGVNTIDAVSIQTPYSIHELSLTVTGDTHKSVVNSSDAENFVPLLISPNVVQGSGLSAVYAGIIPEFDYRSFSNIRDILELNSTTPNVSLSSRFRIANTATTSITGFTGASAEKIVHLHSVVSNTKLVHGIAGGFRLRNNKDALLNINSSITLMYTNGTWLEIGRNFGVDQTGVSYTTSNVTTTRTMDANSMTVDTLADIVGTLISDLKTSRLIN